MGQQLSAAQGFMIGYVPVGVGTNMRIDQEQLFIFYESVGVFEIGLARAHRLYFGALQDDTGLEAIFQKIIVPRGPVAGGIAFAGGYGVTADILRLLRPGLLWGMTGHYAVPFEDHTQPARKACGDMAEVCMLAQTKNLTVS
jgi:hypothetical protein